MHENETDRTRFSFYRESVFAIQSSPIPCKDGLRGRRSTWTTQDVVDEATRKPGACPHLSATEEPQSIFGLRVEEIDAWHSKLMKQARAISIPYVRRDKKHLRAQSATTPILFSAIASYPVPCLAPSAEREKWLRLIVSAACSRFGGNLRSIIAHTDEAFFHVHIFCDCDGASVRSLHAGHAAADKEPLKALKGAAYRRGCSDVLDYFHAQVGAPLGWVRTSPSPRPRLTRFQALRQRQNDIEQHELELIARRSKVEENARMIQMQRVDHDRLLHLEQAALESQQFSLQEQQALLNQRKEKIEREVALQWSVISQATEKLVAWQQEIKDQLAIESRLAKLRQRPAPGKRVASYDDDDDFSDVPF